MPTAAVTEKEAKASPYTQFVVTLSVSDVAQLRRHYDTYQWKRMLVLDLLKYRADAVEILRGSSHIERLVLLSPEEFHQSESFQTTPERLAEIDQSVEALKSLGLRAGLTGRSAFLRAFGRMLLRGDFKDSD